MYDVVVLGGGPGGYAAAIRASQLGGKAALVEASGMGGTCVLRGCVPSKLWLSVASLLEDIRRAGEFGISVQLGAVNCQDIVARKQGVSNDIKMGMEALLANNGVDVIMGKGKLTSPTTLEVNGQSIEAKKIIIATGSTLAPCTVPGIEAVAFTTDQALEMQSVPESILITDPSYIGVEFAILFSVLGAKVTYAFPTPRILPDEDQDTSQRLAAVLREKGVKLLARHTLVRVEGQNCVLASGQKEQSVEVAKVLLSARQPVTADLGLEALGIGLNADGGIQVNSACCTSVPSVYAIGDCTGGWMLSHVASAMGICAAENCMGKSSKFAANLISRAIWGKVQMGSVGLSEEQAERQGYEVEVGSFPYAINGYAMLRGEVDGAVKMVTDAATGEILGVHIVGAQASELIGEAVLGIQLECTVQEFAKGFRVHPAFSETVVDGARDAASWALYLPKRG